MAADAETSQILTARQVLTKEFTITKFREGYDQGEVDDYLDLVVAALERYESQGAVPGRPADGQAAAEIATLRGQLEQAQRENTALRAAPSGGSDADAAQLRAAGEEITRLRDENSRLRSGQDEAERVINDLRRKLSDAATSTSPQSDAETATGMLAMAQRLHDEQVAEGKATAERLIGEASVEAENKIRASQAEADSRLRDAATKSDEMIRDAEGRSNRILSELEHRRMELERTIESLGEQNSRMREQVRAECTRMLGWLQQQN